MKIKEFLHPDIYRADDFHIFCTTSRIISNWLRMANPLYNLYPCLKDFTFTTLYQYPNMSRKSI